VLGHRQRGNSAAVRLERSSSENLPDHADTGLGLTLLMKNFCRRASIFLGIAAASASNSKTATEVYNNAAASTVVIKTVDPHAMKQSTGTGVVIGSGQVVTNCHVIKNAPLLTVRSADTEYPATLQHADWARDLCSLTVAGLNAPSASIGNSKTLRVGAKVYALGTPKGLALTLSDGIVSGFRERKNGRYIQTTAAISRGSSGGGLFDENAALIGLTTFYVADGQNLNFALPIEWLSELAQRSTTVADELVPIAPVITPWQQTSHDLELQKNWPALLELSERWTKAEADNVDAWKSKGTAFFRTAHAKKAIEAWGMAARLNPDDAEVWFLMAVTHAMADHKAKAIEAYQHALSLEPDDAVAWFGLGEQYGLTGQRSKVRDVYKQLKKLDPVHAEQFFLTVLMP
jgi:hypothetical protein